MLASEIFAICKLLDEAADNLSKLMHTDAADKISVRYWLPDELSGSAIMLREHFAEAFADEFFKQ